MNVKFEGEDVDVPAAKPFEDPDPRTPILVRHARKMQEIADEAAPVHLPVAYVFASRSGRPGAHVVSIIDLGHDPDTGEPRLVVSCICPAMRNLFRRPEGCWAMVWVRAQRGLPTPTA